MESVDILPPEKIAFVAYNIGVYEVVQKFGALITSGKITHDTNDPSKVAELLSESASFYDSELISGLVNTMIHNTTTPTKDVKSIIDRVTPTDVNYVMRQLKAAGVSVPL
jgi:hypothetical protein